VAIKDWSFLLGPGIAAGINALCFATILYQSRLVPRWIPTLGLIGAPLILASSTVTLFGGWEQVSTPAMVLVLPIATWELSVGIYMTVKGFRTPDEGATDPAVGSTVTDRPVLAHA
jgi:hypothetical protein